MEQKSQIEDMCISLTLSGIVFCYKIPILSTFITWGTVDLSYPKTAGLELVTFLGTHTAPPLQPPQLKLLKALLQFGTWNLRSKIWNKDL